MAVASDLPALENRREYKRRAQLGPRRRPRQAARRARPTTRAACSCSTATSRRYMRNAIIAIEDRRFYKNSGVDLRGIGRAFVEDVVDAARRPGRLDDRAAVRQERAARAGPPHGLREAPRGGAGLPPHAQVVQGEDPHRVPQLDLLRQRRLRDRVGRATYFGNEPDHEGCGDHRAPVRQGADARGGGAAGRHRRQPERLRPGRPPRGRDAPAQHRARGDARSRAASAGWSTSTPARGAAGNVRSSRPVRDRRRRTSRPGCASSSSTATARAAPSRAA